jgi:5-methylcytosine-specific restriction endonuclease McrA
MAAPTPRNWIGTRQGAITIVSRGPTNTGGWGSASIWVGQCDCGRRRLVLSRDLRKGKVRTCGHQDCPHRKPRYWGRTREECPHLGGTQLQKDSVWQLTRAKADAIAAQACFYCGRPGPNGLDVRKPGLPYNEHNTLPACRACVLAKGKMSTTEFLQLIEAVAKHHLGLK